MSNRMPSMTALLGLLAIAGYQNRDKIAEWLGSLRGAAQPAGGSVPNVPPPASSQAAPAPAPGGLGGLFGALPEHDVGSFLGGGINDLVDRFQQAGHGSVAASWVNHGPNQPIGPQQMEQALGADTLATLSQQTGLSREELLARLSRELPQAIDNYTPDGQLPPRG